MADKRRRRHSENDSGEEFSQDTLNSSLPERPSECESEGEHLEPELSEYESAVDESRGNEEEETETETEEEEEDEGTAEEDSGEDVIVEGEVVDEERQSGDGEEQPRESLDDDEDKKNPAYIPRKGAFFEHDMRMDPDADEKMMSGRGRGKGRLWKDETKWLHDRYLADEQAPKSRQELMAMYGYDILAAEKPPEAPPRMNTQRGPRGRKFQDFLPDDDDRQRSNKYTSDWVKGQNKSRYDNEYPPVQSDYTEDYPPPRRHTEVRGREGRGGRGSRGQGRRRNYSDLQENVSQRNRPYSQRDRGFDSRTDDTDYQDNVRSNRNTGSRGGRNRSYSDDSERFHGNQDKYGRGYQDSRNRENYGRRDGNKENFPDNRGDYARSRENYGGNRDNFGRTRGSSRGRRDNFRGRNDDQGPPRDNYRYERSDSYPDSNPTQDRNSGYREDRQNRRFNENQSYQGRYESGQVARDDYGNRRSGKEERERKSETRETRQTRDYEREEGGERQFLRPEVSDIRSHAYDKMKSYYTLSPVTDDEKLLNEGLEIENSANSSLVRETMQDLNITVSDMGNRKTFTKEKRGNMGRSQEGGGATGNIGDDGDVRKPQHGGRHQPTLPPRLQQQQQQQQERKKQQAQAQAAQAQSVQPPAPSPAPIAERIDQSQRGSSKRYSSQRQRNVPEGPGYQEGGGVQSPVAQSQPVPPQGPTPTQAPVQIPELSEPPFFNPAYSPPKPGVSIPPPMIRPPPSFPAVSAVMPVSTVGYAPAGPRVTSQRVVTPQIIQGTPAGPPGPPPVFATSSASKPMSVAAPPVSMIPPPPTQLPLGVMYAVPPPPPPFQLQASVPVPQFPAPPQTIPPPTGVPQIPQSQPQESVRGGTTYYSSEGQPRSKSTGTTYYPPELQKKSRVTVRRPKVAIPIVNPEDIKKDGKMGSNEVLVDPAVSPGTTDPLQGSPDIVATDMEKLKLEPHSPVSPGETTTVLSGETTIALPGETTIVSPGETTVADSHLPDQQKVELSEQDAKSDTLEINKLVEEQKENRGHEELSETAEFYDAVENPVQNNEETKQPKAHDDSSHCQEHLDDYQVNTEINEVENKSVDENRLTEEVSSAVEKDNEQDTNLEKDLSTRTISVSDKLIPEVKLEFKVYTDSTVTDQKEEHSEVKSDTGTEI